MADWTRDTGHRGEGRRAQAARAARSGHPADERPGGEGLFSSLVSEFGELKNLRVLDLYAGSGAVGLEALSRGAARVLLVESDARAAAVIKENIGAVALPGAAVAADRVERLLGRPPDGDGYDLVFADPPYAVTDEAVARVLVQLGQRLAGRGRARRGGARHPVGCT